MLPPAMDYCLATMSLLYTAYVLPLKQRDEPPSWAPVMGRSIVCTDPGTPHVAVVSTEST